MNTEQLRAEFEAWSGVHACALGRLKDGRYYSGTVQEKWETWQAAAKSRDKLIGKLTKENRLFDTQRGNLIRVDIELVAMKEFGNDKVWSLAHETIKDARRKRVRSVLTALSHFIPNLLTIDTYSQSFGSDVSTPKEKPND